MIYPFYLNKLSQEQFDKMKLDRPVLTKYNEKDFLVNGVIGGEVVKVSEDETNSNFILVEFKTKNVLSAFRGSGGLEKKEILDFFENMAEKKSFDLNKIYFYFSVRISKDFLERANIKKIGEKSNIQVIGTFRFSTNAKNSKLFLNIVDVYQVFSF